MLLSIQSVDPYLLILAGAAGTDPHLSLGSPMSFDNN